MSQEKNIIAQILGKIMTMKTIAVSAFSKGSTEEKWLTFSLGMACVFVFFPFAQIDAGGYGRNLALGLSGVTFLPVLLLLVFNLHLLLRVLLPGSVFARFSPGNLGYHAVIASVLGLLMIIIAGFALRGVFTTFSTGSLRFGYSLCLLSQAFSLFLSLNMLTANEKSAIRSFFSPQL